MINDMIPEMISIKETAKRTGLSYNAIRKMCLNGDIPNIRIGLRGDFKVNYSALCRILNGMGEMECDNG